MKKAWHFKHTAQSISKHWKTLKNVDDSEVMKRLKNVRSRLSFAIKQK